MLATSTGESVDSAMQAITSLIVQITGAKACAVYEARRGHQALVRIAASGETDFHEELPYRDLDRFVQKPHWASLPLYVDGLIGAVLVLVYPPEAARTEQGNLAGLLPLLRSLLQFVNSRNAQLRTAARVSQLEAEIASEKIVDRISGVLQEHPQLELQTIHTIESHVAKILATSELSEFLQKKLNELEVQAAQRDQTARAKQLLQDRFGLSEQQAYQRLRALSRQRRRRMAAIAAEIMAEYDK